MNNEQIPQAAYVMIQKESASFISEARNITRSIQGFSETQPESAKRIFKAGGKFGYSLAADQLRKKDEEIERLKNHLLKIRQICFKEFVSDEQTVKDFQNISRQVSAAIDPLPVKQEEDQGEKETAKCSNCGDIIEHPLCASCDMALTMPTNEY